MILLGCNEVDKKQKFSSLDIVESHHRDTSMIKIFDLLILKLRIYFVDRPTDIKQFSKLPVQQKIKLALL